MKKALKIVGILILLCVVVIAGAAAWYWDTISIIMSDAEVKETDSHPITYQKGDLPELTESEEDWVCWRGPENNGRSLVKGIKIDWSSGLKKEWEIDFLCTGKTSASWSAPIIKGNRLIVCGRNETSDLVFCLNPDTGDVLWQQSYDADPGSSYGSGFRATPCIDGDLVYTFGRAGDLVCWSLYNGELRWRQNVTELGGEEPTWGHSTSPLVLDDLVIVNGGGKVRTVAFDKISGILRWTCGTGEAGYSGFNTFSIEGQSYLLSFHGKGLAAIDPDDGRELWNQTWETAYDVNATTPIVLDQRVFITSGYKTGAQMIECGLSESKPLWTTKEFASHHSDPVLIDNYLYGYSGDSIQNKGDFKCIDTSNGEIKWSTSDMGWGCTIYVDGYLLCGDIKGNIFLIKPNPDQFELVTQMPKAIESVDSASWTIPVAANGRLYLRFKQNLICYALTGI